ncbi:MAG TPA: hypothetical protein VL243_16280 [Vicinamibacterales bacterium]|nr:hypothetical protein [Vicinamibacterales bacterium]
MEKIRIEQHSFGGALWAVGWLFTIGFLHLDFWRGLLAVLLWPYYMGVTFSPLVGALSRFTR